MNYKFFIFVIILIFVDIKSKRFVFQYLMHKYYLNINDFLNIVVVKNTGVSFGMLQNMPHFVLNLINISIMIYLIHLFKYAEKYKNFYKISLSFIIGGGLGNLIDRLFTGHVADFIDVHYKNYHWPAFNLADSFVCIGVLMLLVHSLLVKK